MDYKHKVIDKIILKKFNGLVRALNKLNFIF